MGVICFDSDPDGWRANTMLRDAALSSGDRFMWVFDTYLDERSGYFFEINPAGSMSDSLVLSGGGQQRAWDGIWTARVVRTEFGWVAEIEFPFRTLNFDPNGQGWGVNFQRTVRRKNEESIWNGSARNQNLRTMSNAGLMVGLSQISQGVGLDLKPYLTGTSVSAPGRDQAGNVFTGDVGGDLIYNLTPNLRANLTLNTDFAETEVDARQVNLTRFPLRFPEKLEFFLEGSSFFNMSGFGDAFFSRRIRVELRRAATDRLWGQADRLDEDFRMQGGGIVLPAGATYSFTRYWINGGLGNGRKIAPSLNIQWGGYFSGTRRDVTPGVTLRPRMGLLVDLEGEWSKIVLPEGSFSTSVFRGRVDSQFSPWISLSSTAQYDTVSRVIGWQARFRWILEPGNDLYFVYTHNWLDDTAGIRTIDRKAASKVVYTHRF